MKMLEFLVSINMEMMYNEVQGIICLVTKKRQCSKKDTQAKQEF